MLRAILGIILGYITMAALIVLMFTGAYFAMGANRAFKPASYEPSTLWIGVSLALGLAAAVVGGVACRAISRRGWAGVILALVTIGLGFALAIPVLSGSVPDPGPRTGDVSNFDAMTKASQPDWLVVLNPVVGAVGIIFGSRLAARRPAVAPA